MCNYKMIDLRFRTITFLAFVDKKKKTIVLLKMFVSSIVIATKGRLHNFIGYYQWTLVAFKIIAYEKKGVKCRLSLLHLADMWRIIYSLWKLLQRKSSNWVLIVERCRWVLVFVYRKCFLLCNNMNTLCMIF